MPTIKRFSEDDVNRNVIGEFSDKAQSAKEFADLVPEKSAEERIFDVYMATGAFTETGARHHAQRDIQRSLHSSVDARFYAEYAEATVPTFGWQPHGVPSAEFLDENSLTVNDLMAVATRDNQRYRGHLQPLLEKGITSDRIDRLMELGFSGAPDPIVALGDLDDDDAATWMAAINDNPKLRLWARDWSLLRTLHDTGITPDDAAAYANTGVEPWVVAGHPDAFNPHDFDEFAAESKLKPDLVSKYIDHNLRYARKPEWMVSAGSAKLYGANFAPADVAALVAAGVEGQHAKSLRTAEKSLSIAELTALTAAGVTSAPQFRAWRDLLGSAPSGSRNADRIVNAVTLGRTTPTQAAAYRNSGFTEPAQWGALADAKLTDLSPWTMALADGRRSNQHHGSGLRTAAANGVAAFVTAGGTPGRLRLVQRAGIPIDVAHLHIDTPDLWAAGEPYRARTSENEQQIIAAGYEVSPIIDQWAWTEENYRDGLS
ncbi:hypothetical protein [Leifsonia sp. Leaf264]|uniref:hypothetical protein n=1 Tax=Leifsonia sp. Leaf264 TaxID=1736314 RepID=UPI0006FFB6B0|nr:hypothetical protein [Leifsonia sp. Leaf264]KQO98848.1 hypothetical protein ASF30_12360 [Leifsonia sp. Leaf264]